MLEALLFDCGGVMVAPVTCDWMLPPAALPILGENFDVAAFRRAKKAAFIHLPDDKHIFTCDEEYAHLLHYYDVALRKEMALSLTDTEIAEIARAQAYGSDRYSFFPDVKPYLAKWSNAYKLGLVSDAPPSLRCIMDETGHSERLSASAYSCEVGCMKPDPRMYLHTLNALGVRPENALYVDDLPDKLAGAQKLGIRCVQMAREMPKGFDPAPPYEGARVFSFAELDALLTTL